MKKPCLRILVVPLPPINRYLLRKIGNTTTVDLKSESVVFYWLNQLWVKK